MKRRTETETFQPTEANSKFLNRREIVKRRGEKSRLLNAALDLLRKQEAQKA